MQAEQPVSGAVEVNTNEFRINDQVIYLLTKAKPYSLYVGIRGGVVLQLKGKRARIGHHKGRSSWVDVRLLRPTGYRAVLEQVFSRHME